MYGINLKFPQNDCRKCKIEKRGIAGNINNERQFPSTTVNPIKTSNIQKKIKTNDEQQKMVGTGDRRIWYRH